MLKSSRYLRCAILLLFYSAVLMSSVSAKAASCKTQSQMTSAERDSLSSTARGMIGEVQNGNVQALHASTIPAVAADFEGIAASVGTLKPLVQRATITVDNIYAFDSSTDPAGATRTDFYCGTQVVVLNFNNLPPGSYALVILHATGVTKPQQISLILFETADHRWLLGGFFSRPMTEVGHDGLWYWTSARNYARRGMNWNAWFYYRVASYLLSPVEFMSSPNLEKLRNEAEHVRPDRLSTAKPWSLNGRGAIFQVTTIDTTGIFDTLDLEVHYAPDAAQIAELRDPPNARRQVTGLMQALLELHPELRDAFHGIWVKADQNSTSKFSLELPMTQIVSVSQQSAITSSAIAQ